MMIDLAISICKKVKDAGGQALFVGGYVRDFLLGKQSKDIDIEVYGLEPSVLLAVLGPGVKFCGESFGVFKVNNCLDVSIPRRERKTGESHTDFEVSCDPHMRVFEAASRRDFTVNAISYDPLENMYHDPFNGISDLSAGILSVVGDRFDEDPLRVLRGFQFISRFNLIPTKRTIDKCRSLKGSLNGIAKERVYEEFLKWANGSHPSAGLKFLRDCEWVEGFPELVALIGCEQSPIHHPEGDVWTHTLHVCDEMAAVDGHDYVDMFVALFHDIGKPATTKINEGKITAYGHAEVGSTMACEFFEKYFDGFLIKDLALISQLIKIHMYRPMVDYSAKSMRKFVNRKLGIASLDRFEKIIKADCFGRPPKPKELSDEMKRFLKDCKEYVPPVVKGQDLLDKGMNPGPQIGDKLRELRNIHISTCASREELLGLV